MRRAVTPSRRGRVAALAVVAACLGLIPGCLRYQEEWVLLPDGSGKMTIHFGFNLDVLDRMKDFGANVEDLESKLDFSKIAFSPDGSETGFVALSKPRSEKKDGWSTFTVTAYFDDINKVYFRTPAAGEAPKPIFSFKKEGDGFVLEVDDSYLKFGSKTVPLDKLKEMPEDQADTMWAMFKDFATGLDLARSVKMPGAVVSADGYASKSGRVAANKLAESDIRKVADFAGAAEMVKASRRRIVCGKSEASEEEIAAFKKELEEAKAAWPKIKEEMKAEAARKGKSEEEKQRERVRQAEEEVRKAKEELERLKKEEEK